MKVYQEYLLSLVNLLIHVILVLMNIDLMIKRLKNSLHDPSEWKIVGHKLAKEIFNRRRDVLRRFWIALDLISDNCLGFYARGYKDALIDVARVYEAELVYDKNIRKVKEFLLKKEYTRILDSLLLSAKTPKELSVELEMDEHKLIEFLKELKNLGLVDGFSTHIYRITIQGEEVIKNVG